MKNLKTISKSNNFKTFAKYFFAFFAIMLLGFCGMTIISNGTEQAKDAGAYQHYTSIQNTTGTTPTLSNYSSLKDYFLPSGTTAVLETDWAERLFNNQSSTSYWSDENDNNYYRHNIKEIIFTKDIVSTLQSYYSGQNTNYATTDNSQAKLYHYRRTQSSNTDEDGNVISTTYTYYIYQHYQVFNVGTSANRSGVKAYVFYDNYSAKSTSASTTNLATVFIASNNQTIKLQGNTFGIDPYTDPISGDTSSSTGVKDYYYSYHGHYTDNYVEGMNGSVRNHWFSNLESIDFGNCVAPYNATSYQLLFAGCGKLTTLSNYGNLFSTLLTSTHKDLSGMFYYCESLTSIPSISITSSQTSLLSMFEGCSSLTSLNLSSWFVSGVTNFTSIFADCHSLTAVPTGVVDWDISSATTLSAMFKDCRAITSFDELINDSSKNFIAKMKTSADISWMFYDCDSVTSIDLSVLLGHLTASGNASYLTGGMNGLTSIAGLEYYSKFSNVSGLFANWHQLTASNIVSLIGNLNTANAKYMNGLFFNCQNLNSILHVLKLPNLSMVNVEDIGQIFSGWKITNLDYFQAFITNYYYNGSSLSLRGGASKTTAITNMSGTFKKCTSLTSFTDTYLNHDGGSRTSFSWKPTNTSSMFANCTSLSSLDGISIIDTSNTTTMEQMFYNSGISSLDELDQLKFNSVTTTSYMFAYTPLSNLSSNSATINPSSLTNMSYMFYGCSSLTSIGNFAYFNCSNATNMNYMFARTKLANLNGLTSVNMSSAKNAYRMFFNCSSLTAVSDNTASGTKATSLTNIKEMFSYSKVTSLANMIKLNLSSVTNASYMFLACTSLNNITGLSSVALTGTNVDASYMFYGCTALQYVDSDTSGEEVDFSGVKNISYMFSKSGVKSLSSMIKFKTPNVTNASYMFYECDSLTSIAGLSSLPLTSSSGVDASYMFAECDSTSFTTADFSSGTIDFSGVTTFAYMFDNSGSLKTVKFPAGNNFKTDKLINTSYMFRNTSLATMTNLEYFDTDKVTNMSYMFNYCDFVTFDASRLHTDAVTTMYEMFWGCTKMTDITFKTASYNNFKTNNVTNTRWMFETCSKLETLDLTCFDTTSLTNMNQMFSGCTSLVSVDLSSFNLSSVTSYANPFSNCSAIKEIYAPSGLKSGVSLTLPKELCNEKTSVVTSSIDADHLSTSVSDKTRLAVYGTISYSSDDLANVTNTNPTAYCWSTSAQTITLTPPTRDGWKFDGWTLTSTGTNHSFDPATATLTINADSTDSITLSMAWKQDTLTLHAIDIDGIVTDAVFPDTTTIYTTNTAYGNAYGTLPVPTSANYNFLGWWDGSDESSFIAAADIATTLVSVDGDHTLYAKWEGKPVTITLDLNGGDALATTSYTFKYGETYPNPTFPTPTRTNHIFLGWFDAATGGNKFEKDGQTVTDTADFTLYAQWQIGQIEVSFDTNGGVVINDILTANFGSSYGFLPTPSRTGYDFDGWYLNLADDTTLVTASTIVTTPSNHTLYAKWTPLGYSITFVTPTTDTLGNSLVGSITLSETTRDIVYGLSFGNAFPTFTLLGYTLEGWFLDQDFTTQVNNTDTVTLTSSQNLYAKLTPDNVTLTFEGYAYDTNGNALYDTFSYNDTIATTYGANITIPVISDLAGYTFGGWYVDIADENTKLVNTQINFTENRTYKTKWTIKEFTITISPNDPSIGSTNETTLSRPYYTSISSSGGTLSIGGTTVTATIIETPGYNISFTGWTIPATTLTADQTITANFVSEAKDIVLSFNVNTPDNYGSALLDTPVIDITTLTIKYNEQITNLPVPYFSVSPVGYNFLGWYTESGTLVENGTTMLFTETTNIVAQWQIKEYTFNISKEGEGGEIDKTSIIAKYKTTLALDTSDDKILNIGADSSTATLEVNAGYDISFLGFYLDGTLITNTTNIVIDDNAKTDIVAKFSKTARQFTVTFHPADGSFTGSDAGQTSITKTYTFDQVYSGIPSAYKEGYNFSGWYTSDGLVQIAENETVLITNNTDVYANFSLTMFTVTIVVENSEYGKVNGQTAIQINDIGYGTNASLSGDTLTIAGINYVASKNNQTGYTITIDWLANGTSFTASGAHTIVRDTVITAKYSNSANTYTLTYNLNTVDTDGDALLSEHPTTYPNVDVTYNSTYPTLPAPTLEGYTFKRWVLNGSQITSGQIVNTDSNQTLIAEWQINKFKVTISINNSAIGSISSTAVNDVEFGTLIKVNGTRLSVGTNNIDASLKANDTGYTNAFVNWTKDNAEISAFNMPNGAITIIANFSRTANTYSVDFDPDGGTYLAPYTVTFAETYGSYISTEPTKTGYDFVGWFLNAQLITADTSVNTASAHTLVAHWQIKTFNISFGVAGDAGTLSQTQIITVDWNTKVSVSDNVFVIHASPLQSVTANTKNIEGYTTSFDGWTLNGNAFNSQLFISESILIVANFSKDPINFLVAFNSVGGSNISETKTIYYGEAYGDLPKPTLYGHNFTGWYLTADYSSEQVFSSTRLKTTAPALMLYAKWSPKTIIVSYVANTEDDLNKTLHGTPSLNGNLTKTYKFTDAYTTLPTPTLTGYTFQYWQSAGGNMITSYSTMIDENNHELYAVWVANVYSINFETNGGDEKENIDVKYNSSYGVLPETSKVGHIFQGWYSNASCTDAYKVTSDTILLDENRLTLYAKWETIKYTIKITTNSEDLGYVNISELALVPYGSKIAIDNRKLTILDNSIIANVNIRYGYNVSFTGWTVDESSLSNSMVERDMTIRANFTIAPKTVYIYLIVDTKDTFGMKLNGTPTLETPLSFSTKFGNNLYELISEPTLKGYNFCGWYLDKNYTKKLATDTVVDLEEQMMLYAKWEQIIEPINVTEIIIYVAIGVAAVVIIVTVVVILRKQKEKDHFDMGLS